MSRGDARAEADPWGSLVAAHDGAVIEFDADAGLGVVEDIAGRRYPFHCTAIADGTRSIEVGAAVRFSIAARARRPPRGP